MITLSLHLYVLRDTVFLRWVRDAFSLHLLCPLLGRGSRRGGRVGLTPAAWFPLAQVPDFNVMYELYDECTCMFFFRNKHIMIDLGTGNNNKINFLISDKQEMIDIIETVYRGARKGRGLVVSPKDYSTRYRY